MRLCVGAKPVHSRHFHVPLCIHRDVCSTGFRLHHGVCHRLTSPLSQLLSEVRSIFVPPCDLCQLPYVTVVLTDGVNGNHLITEFLRQGPVQPRYLGVIRPIRSSRVGQRSEFLTNSLLKKQRVACAASTDAKIRAQTPVKVISYVATRWLSMLQVIRRALKLRKYLTEIWQEQNYYWQR
jgi:hypothetical protein